jgi:uncharacterized membrane protein
MTTLIAIGYPDEITASRAAEEARRMTRDLVIQPDAIATVRRDVDGRFHTSTSHHAAADGAGWGMFWGFLFGLVFFVPFLGMALGAGLGALLGKIEKSGIDKDFQKQVRAMLQPGTSALFLIVETITPDAAAERLRQFGGTVLKTSLSSETEEALQEALHGGAAQSTSSD